MENKIRQQLPAALQGLVDEIETAAGVEIEVTHAPEIAKASPLPADSLVGTLAPALFCAVTHIGPTLADTRFTIKYARDLAATIRGYCEPYMAFCHELLHLRRYVVLRVPSVMDRMSAPGIPEVVMHGLEDILEHLVIDRQLKDYGFLVPVEDCDRRFWNQFSANAAHTMHFKASVLLEWLRTRYLSSNIGIKKRADQFVEKCGLLGCAWRLLDEARPLLDLAHPDPADAKLRLVWHFCKASEIPLQAVTIISRRDDGYCQGRLV